MWIVMMAHSFDADTPCYKFNNEEYDKAKAYLHWLWEEYYNTEIAEGSELDNTMCYHEDEYAKVTWRDGEKTEFYLTYTSPYDEKFFEGNWKKYL